MVNNETVEIRVNELKGKTVSTFCNKCQKSINHQVLMDYCESGKEIIDSEPDILHGRIDYTAHFSNDYQIIKCFGCNTISYRSDNYFSEYQDNFNGGTGNGTWEERYPLPIRRIEKDYKCLSSFLKQIYKETIFTYNNKVFILCAAGIRAILEGICKDKDIIEGKLNEKIKKMREQNFIIPLHEDVLHKLRFLGNEALHDLQTPAEEEIVSALDIIEHIIESLYEIVGKSENIKRNGNKHNR